MWFLVLMTSAAEGSDKGPYAIMRIAKIKSIRAGNKTKAHNARQLPCYNADPNISNTRISLTPEMKELEGKTFKEIFDERTQGQKIRKNAVYGIEVVMTYSPEAQIEGETALQWAKKSIEWAAALFNKENIIDLVWHFDEQTPHLHLTVIPIDSRGKLNAKAFLDGNAKRFEKLQDDYAAAVSEFGLKRGLPKEETKAKNKAARAWRAETAARGILEDEPA